MRSKSKSYQYKIVEISFDQDKLNNHINNLWLCITSTHELAHATYNKICEKLMHNYHKYSGIEFNKEIGKYYLKEK